MFAISFHLVSPPAIFCAGAMIMEIGSASQGVLYLFPNWLSFLFHGKRRTQITMARKQTTPKCQTTDMPRASTTRHPPPTTHHPPPTLAIGMTASNLVAVSLAYIYFDAGAGSLGLRVGFCVVIVVLSGLRQLFCVNNCGEYLSNRGGKKSVKAA